MNASAAKSNIDIQKANAGILEAQAQRSQLLVGNQLSASGIANQATSAQTKTMAGTAKGSALGSLNAPSATDVNESRPLISAQQVGLATFVKLQDGVGKLYAQQSTDQKLKKLGPGGGGGEGAKSGPVTDPSEVIGAHNEYVDMSKSNILTAMHPDRLINAQILKKYNPHYRASDAVELQLHKIANAQKASTRKRRLPKIAAVGDDEQKQKGEKAGNAKGRHQSVLNKKDRKSSLLADKAAAEEEEKEKARLLEQQKREESAYQKALEKKLKKPIYDTLIDGQLLSAQFRVDNYSQAESFFQSLHDNLVTEFVPRKGFPQQVGVSPRFASPGTSPYAARRSMRGPEHLPAPPKALRSILYEAVNQEHLDSSEDEIRQDGAFQTRAKDASDELILALSKEQVENLSESIRNHNYKQVRAKGEVTADTLYQLGFKTRGPGLPAVKSKLVNQAKFKVVQTSEDLRLKRFVSGVTKTRLVRDGTRPNPKSYELQHEQLPEEHQLYSDDEEQNQKRSGLPSIKNFYRHFKEADKRVQLGHEARQPQIAYIHALEKGKWLKEEEGPLRVLPVPLGIVTHKGRNNEIDLNNLSIGNDQARALGSSLKYSNVEKVLLRNNRLGTKGALSIIEGINPHLRELNLSNNALTDNKEKFKSRQQFLQEMAQRELDAEYDDEEDAAAGPGLPVSQLSQYTAATGKSAGKKKQKSPRRQATKRDTIMSLEGEGEEGEYAHRSKCVTALCAKIDDRLLNLEAIYLNRCSLTDQNARQILYQSIFKASNAKISKIFFNENYLTDTTAEWVAEVLAEGNTRIRELGLKGNQITGTGGAMIADALQANRDLKILDLGWNRLGVRAFRQRKAGAPPMRKGDVGRAWGHMLSANKTLVHLDLSFNRFAAEDAAIVQSEIRENHSLIGFHFQGNTGNGDREIAKVDPLGFIEFEDIYDYDASGMHAGIGIPDGNHRKGQTRKYQRNAYQRRCTDRWTSTQNTGRGSSTVRTDQSTRPYVELDTQLGNCWICEAWIECEFQIDLVDSLKRGFGVDLEVSTDLDKLYPVYMHFDFDNYDADKMEDLRAVSMELRGTFKAHRMVPQGYYHYFFSYENYYFIDEAAMKVSLKAQHQYAIRQKLSQKENRHGFAIKDFDLMYLNQINTLERLQELVQEQKQNKPDETKSETLEELKLAGPVDQPFSTLMAFDQVAGGKLAVHDLSEDTVDGRTTETKMRSTMDIGTMMSGFTSQAATPNVPMQTQNTPAGQHLTPFTRTQMSFGRDAPTTPAALRFDSIFGNEERKRKGKHPKADPPYQLMDPETYQLNIKTCVIRPDNSSDAKARAETPWTVDIGIFKGYLKEDRAQLVVDCFDFDWANMKVPRFRNAEESDVRAEMSRVYPLLKDCYRQQAGFGPAGNVFSIGQNQMYSLTGEVLDCVDEHDAGMLKNTDCDRLFVTVNANSKGKFNPQRCLVRGQLMEFLMRCAIEKFFSAGAVASELEAIAKFNQDYIEPKLEAFTQQNWRRDATLNVEVDNLLKAYLPLWEHVYKRHSGKHTKPGQKDSMMQDEFEDFVAKAGLINDGLFTKDLSLIFNLSMFTQVDELNKSRHLEASTVEFMEMLCRAAHAGAYPPAPTQDAEGVWIESELTAQERADQPLTEKVENMIPIIMQHCCDAKFVKAYKHPKKDKRRNLYVLPNGKFY